MQEDDWLDSVDRYKELPDTAPPVAPPTAKRKRSQRPPPKHGRSDAVGAAVAAQRPQTAAPGPPAAAAAVPRITGSALAAVQANLQPLTSSATPRSEAWPESGPSAASEQTRDGGAVASAPDLSQPPPCATTGVDGGSTAADGPPHTPKAKRRKRVVVKVTPSKACPEGLSGGAGPPPVGALQRANQMKRPMWPKGPGRATVPGSGAGTPDRPA